MPIKSTGGIKLGLAVETTQRQNGVTVKANAWADSVLFFERKDFIDGPESADFP